MLVAFGLGLIFGLLLTRATARLEGPIMHHGVDVGQALLMDFMSTHFSRASLAFSLRR